MAKKVVTLLTDSDRCAATEELRKDVIIRIGGAIFTVGALTWHTLIIPDTNRLV